MSKSQSIPFFNYPKLYSSYKDDFQKIFDDVCSRGSFILQKDLSLFEKALSKYSKIKYSLGVADGTNALLLGLNTQNIKKGDQIIIASHTYIATAAAIKMSGATPVFADIQEDFMISPTSIEEQINKKTKGIMITQLNGRCCNMDKILKIISKYNLKLYEDSAQGIGSKYDGASAGSFGEFGTFSFYPAKTLGSFGDGGAFLTNNKKIYNQVYQFRDHGRDNSGNVVSWGTNSRLDNLQAAFLKFKLKKLNKDIDYRRKIASIYCNELKHLDGVNLPPHPEKSGKYFDTFQNFEVEFQKRDKLRDFLNKNGVRTIIQWNGSPVHHFKKLGFGKYKFKHLKRTDLFFKRCLLLPMNPFLKEDEIYYICKKIREFYRE